MSQPHIVTGAAGFIGSVFVAKLNAEGINNVIAVDESNHLTNENLKKRTLSKRLGKEEFLALISSDLFHKTYGLPASITHMGACSSTTEKNFEYLKQNNFEYTKALAEYSLKHGIRFIYASSGATYGDGTLGYSDDDAVTPTLKPLNFYGTSKQMFDIWVLENHYESKIVGLKFFNVYGPNEYHKGEMRSVVQKSYEQVKEKGYVSLFKSYKPEFKDGDQKRDFIYVKDCSDVMWWFLKNQSINGIYNLGTGKARSWNDLVKAVFAALQKDPSIRYIEMPEDLKGQYQYFTEAKMEKLLATKCPFKPTSLEDGVRDYVQNYLEAKDPII